ncbi:MAG: hypothetical protein NVSMB2_24020 [Chloroflexota bacterium]
MSHSSGGEPTQKRVERALEEGLERVETPEAAQAIIDRIERLAAGQTEAERGDATAKADEHSPDPAEAAAADIEHASAVATTVADERAVADLLAETAAQTIASVEAAEPVVAGAQATLLPQAPVSSRAHRGRRLLKEALLRRMGPLSALDARIYLAINEAPHPPWVDSVAWALAIITTGGWIWVVGVLVAYLVRIPDSWRAVKRLLPSVVGATWVIEYPIKAFFRRRRPFSAIVEALVIGKKPGSWSFPSGHTGSSFASAWVLSRIWPRQAPIFFGLASVVGFSRIYLGAHYPGDVLSGAALGMLLSEAIRRINRALFG